MRTARMTGCFQGSQKHLAISNSQRPKASLESCAIIGNSVIFLQYQLSPTRKRRSSRLRALDAENELLWAWPARAAGTLGEGHSIEAGRGKKCACFKSCRTQPLALAPAEAMPASCQLSRWPACSCSSRRAGREPPAACQKPGIPKRAVLARLALEPAANAEQSTGKVKK